MDILHTFSVPKQGGFKLTGWICRESLKKGGGAKKKKGKKFFLAKGRVFFFEEQLAITRLEGSGWRRQKNRGEAEKETRVLGA